MANPLARVMMDQMSKKNGKIKIGNPSVSVERVSNLDTKEEAIISSVIQRNHSTLEIGNDAGTSTYQGKKVALQDLVKNTSEKEGKSTNKSLQGDENGTEKNKDQRVKNPYKRGKVQSSVLTNPDKGVSAVSLKSLGKGNLL